MSRSAVLLVLLAGCGRAQPPPDTPTPLTQAPLGEGYPLVREAARSRVEATAGPQVGASVAGLVPTGGFVVAYEGANGSQIFACVYSDNGTEVVGEFQLNTDTSGVQGEVKVSGLADGGFVAVWRRLSTHELVGRCFSDGGVGVGDEFVVAPMGADAGGHRVAGLTGGKLVVTWVADGVGVLCNVYEPSGQAVFKKPVTVRAEPDVPPPSPLRNQGLAALDDGGFACVTSVGTHVLTEEHVSVVTQTFSSTLEPGKVHNVTHAVGSSAASSVEAAVCSLSTGFVVTVHYPGAYWPCNIFSFAGDVQQSFIMMNGTLVTAAQSRVSLSRFVSGGFMVTWRESDGAGGDTRVLAKVYTENGFDVRRDYIFQFHPFVPEYLRDRRDEVLIATVPEDGGPGIVTSCNMGDDRVAVVYSDAGELYSNVYSHARPHSTPRTAIGDGFPLVSETGLFSVGGTPGAQTGASVASLGSGGFAVAYERANGSQVFACVYSEDGTQVVGEFQLNTDTSGVQGEVKVSGLADGGFVAVWRRLSTHELVGRCFTSCGVGVGDEFVVAPMGVDAGGHRVAGLTGGKLVVTWVADGVGVLCNVYEPSGQAVFEKPVTVREWEHKTKDWTASMQSDVTSLDDGGFAVAASHTRFIGVPGRRGSLTNTTISCVVLTWQAVQVTAWEVAHFVKSWDPQVPPVELAVQSRGDKLTFLGLDTTYIAQPDPRAGHQVSNIYFTNGTMDSPLGFHRLLTMDLIYYHYGTISPSVVMLPSGDVVVTTALRYNDGFGLNRTYAVFGRLYEWQSGYQAPPGLPQWLRVSTVEGPLVSSSAGLSQNRTVVVGDTNSMDGIPTVYCQIYDVLALKHVPHSQQVCQNTTAPATDSPIEMTAQPVVPTTDSPIEMTAQPVVPTTDSPIEMTAQPVVPTTDSPIEMTAQPVVPTTDSPIEVTMRTVAPATDSPMEATTQPIDNTTDAGTGDSAATDSPQQSAAPASGAGCSTGWVVRDTGFVFLALAAVGICLCGVAVGVVAMRRTRADAVGTSAFDYENVVLSEEELGKVDETRL